MAVEVTLFSRSTDSDWSRFNWKNHTFKAKDLWKKFISSVHLLVEDFMVDLDDWGIMGCLNPYNSRHLTSSTDTHLEKKNKTKQWQICLKGFKQILHATYLLYLPPATPALGFLL